MKPMMTLFVTVVATILFTAGMLALPGCGRKDDPAPPARPVRTMVVEEGTSFSGRVFPGRAEAVQAVDIAFEVQGQLIERPVKVGDVVTQGQVLAKLDPRDYRNDVESARAKLDRAEAYQDRILQAAKTGAVSEQDATDARAQYDVAEASLKVKKKALADTDIVAPFGGTIAATYVENFQNVQAKQVVVRLLDLSEIELKIDIPEALIGLVPQLKDLIVSFDAHPDQPVPAEVKEIGKEASATTRTYPVTLSMQQPAEFELLPGMTGQARKRPGGPQVKTEGILQVHASAVFEEAGKQFVWVVDDTTLTVRRCEIQPRGVNVAGLLVEGIAPGQRIVTAGVHELSEGQKVRLLDETPETGSAP